MTGEKSKNGTSAWLGLEGARRAGLSRAGYIRVTTDTPRLPVGRRRTRTIVVGMIVVMVVVMAMVVRASRLLLFDLLAHVIHVQRLDLVEEVVQGGARDHAGTGEHQDLVAEHHQGRDGLDLERPRQLG